MELADGGTLFLNEVGDLPLDRQVELMQVTADVRIVASDASEPSVRRRERALPIRPLFAPQRLSHRVATAAGPPRRHRASGPTRHGTRIEEAGQVDPGDRAGNALQAARPSMAGQRAGAGDHDRTRGGSTNGDTLAIHWDLGDRATMTPVTSESASGEVLTLEALERGTHHHGAPTHARGVIEGPEKGPPACSTSPSTARFRMKKLGIARGDFSH